MMNQNTGERIVRWSAAPGVLTLEEYARRGIESVAGLVITEDIFRTNNYPDAHFCACAEIYHSVVGSGVNFDDYIGINFRVVEIRNGTYPMVGRESARMVIQPLSDGRVSARWDSAYTDPLDRSSDGPRLLTEKMDAQSAVCRPLTLGEIPAQEEGDFAHPSFLLLKDPGAGWQVWRRFSPAGSDGLPVMEDGFREESFTMVYPVLSPYMNWRFRIYDLPGGGVRWEVDTRNRQ